MTRDGVPVIHHDPALNPNTTRGPDGTWLTETGPLIRDLTLAELQCYDVGRLRPGTAYAATYASQISQDSARIPTLDALLRRRPGIRFNIELKLMPAYPEWTVAPEDMVERVLQVVDAASAADRVAIQSFDWRAPRHVRRIRPDLAVGWLTDADAVPEAIPDAIVAEGGGHWAPYYTQLTPALITHAHANGLTVIPWTVNDPADMQRLIAWGVDGLITDWPDRALTLRPATR